MMPASVPLGRVVRKGASTLLEALDRLFWIDEGVFKEPRYLRALGFYKMFPEGIRTSLL